MRGTWPSWAKVRLLAVLALLLGGAGFAYAQAKQPAPPPQDATGELNTTPPRPSPLTIMKPPSMGGVAANPEAMQENYDLFTLNDSDTTLEYLVKLFEDETPTANAQVFLAILKRLQHVAQVNRLWLAVIPVLVRSDPIGLEAIVRCVIDGIDIQENGKTVPVSPESPRIDMVCISEYQKGGLDFLKSKVGLSDASVAEQVFTGTTLKKIRTYVGDARLEKVKAADGNDTTVVRLYLASALVPYADGSYFEGLIPRRATLQGTIESKLGADCEKDPGNPFVWDATFASIGIDVRSVIYEEAHRVDEVCDPLKLALAGEALKREADFVLAQLALRASDLSLHPALRDQIEQWRASLSRRLGLWVQDETRVGTTLAQVFESIEKVREDRLRVVFNTIMRPKLP